MKIQPTRKRLFLKRFAVLACCSLGLSYGLANAQSYPNKPIRMLVGNPSGGTTDVIARLLANAMTDKLGQSIVVENRAGASGLIAAETAAKSNADGYTILMAPSQLSTFSALYPNSNFRADKDLQPLGLVATSPYVMVVHPSLEVRTFQELIAYAKAQPDSISYAGSTPGSVQHLSWEIIKKATDVDMQFVPYGGTSALLPDLLAGRLQAGIDNVAILTPYIQKGQLCSIAVTSQKPSSLLPDVPTIAASSDLKDFDALGWFGVFAPADLPLETATALNEALVHAMASKEIIHKLNELGAEPQSGSATDLAAILARDSLVWGDVIREAGVTAQ